MTDPFAPAGEPAAVRPPPSPRFWQTVSGRRRIRGLLFLLAAAAAGYLAAFILFPARLVSEDRAVQRVWGLPLDEAKRVVEDQGFRVRIAEPAPDPVQPAGRVVWQEPAPETFLPEGSMVRLTASSGPGQAPIPDVVGFDIPLAGRVLESAGFAVGQTEMIAAAAEAGVVVATRPGAGTGRAIGAAVDLVVSRGPANIRIPALVGLSLDDARTRLLLSGLRLGAVAGKTGAADAGVVVVGQRPAPGVLSPRDARVDVTVSERPGGGDQGRALEGKNE